MLSSLRALSSSPIARRAGSLQAPLVDPRPPRLVNSALNANVTTRKSSSSSSSKTRETKEDGKDSSTTTTKTTTTAADETSPPAKKGEAEAPVGKVWMVTIDYYYDDYKRPQGSSENVGTYTTRRAAAIAGVTAALAENGQYFSKRADVPPDASEKQKKRWAEDFKVQDAYAAVARKVKDVNFDDDKAAKAFKVEHDKKLEEFLGPSEFGIMSSGYRPYWTLCTIAGDEEAEKRYAEVWAVFDANDGVIPYDYGKEQ